MKVHRLRTSLVRGSAFLTITAALPIAASAAIVSTDGFGDGDRDNNGTTEVAATNPADVGLKWFYAGGGTSGSILQAVDDSSGIGTGNALQLFNSPGQNNRPIIGHLPSTVTLNDGDSVALRFDMRVVSNSVITDRVFRFGLYNDAGNNYSDGDKGSTDTTNQDDLGYMARVDIGADTSNSTAMDVTRDDSSTGVIGGTATALTPSVQSNVTANQIVDSAKHHFVLTLTRSGGNMTVGLQQDSNALLSGTDTTIGALSAFAFNEVMFTTRSNSLTDYRFDNIEVEYTAGVPEPTSVATIGLAALGLLVRRRRSN